MATVNNTDMNVGVQVSLQDNDFVFKGKQYTQGEIVGSPSITFNFLRNLHSVGISLHSKCTKVLFHAVLTSLYLLSFL